MAALFALAGTAPRRSRDRLLLGVLVTPRRRPLVTQTSPPQPSGSSGNWSSSCRGLGATSDVDRIARAMHARRDLIAAKIGLCVCRVEAGEVVFEDGDDAALLVERRQRDRKLSGTRVWLIFGCTTRA